jgi:hypothetical protein
MVVDAFVQLVQHGKPQGGGKVDARLDHGILGAAVQGMDGHGESRARKNNAMLAKWGVVAAAALGTTAAMAQDVAFLGGRTKVAGFEAPTFGLNYSYSHDIAPNLAAGFAYVNEGHVPGHHRDGVAVQLWLQGETAPGLQLGIAAGPYQYFDTTRAESATGFQDAHGTGALYSAMATWRGRGSRIFLRARIDRIEAQASPDSTQLLLGVGYRLDQDGSLRANSDGKSWRRSNDGEVTLYAGKTIVNSFESESAAARGAEYRHAFGPVLRGSIAWMKEGDARLIRRDGVLVQGWLEPSFNDDRWTMGVGYGAYFAVDQYRATPRHVSPALTMTLSCNVGARWIARLNWYRVISNYDRDSDVLLLGAGYRF